MSPGKHQGSVSWVLFVEIDVEMRTPKHTASVNLTFHFRKSTFFISLITSVFKVFNKGIIDRPSLTDVDLKILLSIQVFICSLSVF